MAAAAAAAVIAAAASVAPGVAVLLGRNTVEQAEADDVTAMDSLPFDSIAAPDDDDDDPDIGILVARI